MQRKLAWAGGLVLGMGLFLTANPASALVTRKISLKDELKSTFIFLARVEALPADRPALVLAVGEQFKGKFPFPKLTVLLAGDTEAKKSNHLPQLRRRLAPGLPLVIFCNQRDKQGKVFTLFAFTNGTWFQMVGRPAGDRIVWRFTHCEPYLRRTYAGTTAELRRIVVDGLSGKREPPAPNMQEKPGLGPELERSSGSQALPSGGGRYLFAYCPILSPAVIPTLGLGGPLAVLAMLFPSLFGGAILVFRSWLALLTVASLNSTLLILHLWLGRTLEGTVLGSPQGLWWTMLLVTLAGILWAWRRHLPAPGTAATETPRPTRSEQVILWISSLAFLGSLLYCWLAGALNDPADPAWKLLLVLGVGFWAGTGYILYRRFLVRSPAARPVLPTEGVILWAMVVASTGLAAAWPAVGGVSRTTSGEGAVRQVWQAGFSDKQGFIVSSPLFQGDRVFVAGAFKQGGEFYGGVFCLNADTGKEIWTFDNDGDMQQVFSNPCVADGRLYIGEGFHENKGCRLFCLDAATGKSLWKEPFQTESHVESTPCVAGGRVFFGAGDDGVYCVSTEGKKLWQFPRPNDDTRPTVGKALQDRQRLKLHVDASPAVAGDLVYVGSGIDRDAEDKGDPAVFCLDARTGRKVWLRAIGRRDLPVWGSPVVADGQVFFGLGNGDILDDAKGERPAGALLCLDRKTGKELWRTPVANGVVRKPVVDQRHVYFGCRDGSCYCLDRADGRVFWKKDLGSPIVATPALFRCAHCGTARLYAAASRGRVGCLDADTGYLYWTFDLGGTALLTSPPDVAVLSTSQGECRRIVFGAGLGGPSGAPAVFCLEDKGAPARTGPGE